jgi:hypothetical protein
MFGISTALMPWKIFSAVGERARFTLAALKQLKPFTVLCQTFGISRRCGYKWLERFRRAGRSGLPNRSRRPRCSPRRTPVRWRQAVRRLRQRFPHWGAKKIYPRLRRQFPHARLPAVRPITKWLPRLCPMRRPHRHSRRGPHLTLPPLPLPAAPNDVWTVDFKGFFRTADGTHCDPLTVRDLFSRLLLAVRILPHQRQAAVRRVFIGLFRRFGLPKVIRMDNGSPFGSTGAWGLSALSVWWLTLGIRVEFIRPGHPEENGAHEQMHRELKRDTARPHEALGGRYPSDRYRRSRRRYRGPQPIRYPRGWVVRHVRHNGQIKWQGRRRSLGETFVGQAVAWRRQTAGSYEVYFQRLLLGTLHDRDAGGIRPSKPRRSKT